MLDVCEIQLIIMHLTGYYYTKMGILRSCLSIRSWYLSIFD